MMKKTFGRSVEAVKQLLVVVDMQVDFITGALGTPEAEAILPAVCRRIREFPGDVICTRDTHGADYLQTQEGRKLPIVHCVKNTPGWQLHPDVLAAGEGKIRAVLDKPTFGSALLCDFAAVGGYESIELIGLCTDICVISNALCLKSRLWEIPISVRADCCAGATPEGHKTALSAMKTCQIEVENF